jgi:hypothetical protein
MLYLKRLTSHSRSVVKGRFLRGFPSNSPFSAPICGEREILEGLPLKLPLLSPDLW